MSTDAAADLEAHLRRGGAGDTLVGHAVKGTAWTLSAQWLRLLLTTGSTVVLARLLTPADYGLIGMVSAVIGIAQLLLGLGLSQATVQRAQLTNGQVNALFWVNASVGVVLAGVTGSAAGLIADFYGRGELVAITMAMSSSFVFGGLTVQHQALLNRQMRFRDLASIEVLSQGASIVVAIGMAASGFGYWALVALPLVAALLRLILTWQRCTWRPGRPRRAEGTGELLRFGAGLSVFTIVNYIARNVDNVAIGRRWGADQLGIYAKAYSLLLLPLDQLTTPLSRVALPTLSALQDEPTRFRNYFLSAVSIVAYVAMPVVVGLSVLAQEVVAIMLGPQWTAAAPVFQVLALSGIAQTIGSTNGWLYVATDRTSAQAVWGLVSRPVIVASFFVGLPWGPYGVAVAYTVAGYVLLVPSFVAATRDTPVSVGMIGRAVWKPLVATLAMGLVTSAVRIPFMDLHVVLRTLAIGLLGGTVYLGVSLLLPGGRQELSTLVAAVRSGLRSHSADG